jgi:hypothetical protein
MRASFARVSLETSILHRTLIMNWNFSIGQHFKFVLHFHSPRHPAACTFYGKHVHWVLKCWVFYSSQLKTDSLCCSSNVVLWQRWNWRVCDCTWAGWAKFLKLLCNSSTASCTYACQRAPVWSFCFSEDAHQLHPRASEGIWRHLTLSRMCRVWVPVRGPSLLD